MAKTILSPSRGEETGVDVGLDAAQHQANGTEWECPTAREGGYDNRLRNTQVGLNWFRECPRTDPWDTSQTRLFGRRCGLAGEIRT